MIIKIRKFIARLIRGFYFIIHKRQPFCKFFNNKYFTNYYRKITSPLRTLPDFLIIGVERGGTTSLYKYLTKHPSIVPPIRKEVHFFDWSFSKKIRKYKAFFPSLGFKFYYKYVLKRGFATGEATPGYILHPQIAKRVFTLLPHVKIILLLRNPADRAYSHFHLTKFVGKEGLSFRDALEREAERLETDKRKILEDPNYIGFNTIHFSYLTRGIYIDQIKNWDQYFPKEQIMIIKSEDLLTKTDEILNDILKFLNLPKFQMKFYQKFNVGNYDEIDINTRNWLINYFKPYNQKLYKYLNREFDWDI